MNLLQSFYAQQQAAAAALEAQRRAAAQAAYDRSMTALNNSYNTMQNSLKGNYNSTLGQLEQNYNTGVAGVNKQADNAQQQAYINYMMNKRDMGQQLAAQGLSGGASESALAGMYNNYGNSRNTIDSGRSDSLADLMNDWNTNKASALQAYNSQLAEMAMQKANAVQQLENNLANLIANMARPSSTPFGFGVYLSKMTCQQRRHYEPRDEALFAEHLQPAPSRHSGHAICSTPTSRRGRRWTSTERDRHLHRARGKRAAHLYAVSAPQAAQNGKGRHLRMPPFLHAWERRKT